MIGYNENENEDPKEIREEAKVLVINHLDSFWVMMKMMIRKNSEFDYFIRTRWIEKTRSLADMWDRKSVV